MCLMKRWSAAALVSLLLFCGGCAPQGESKIPQGSSIPVEEELPETGGSSASVAEYGAAQRYYDALLGTNVNLLICEEGKSFADSQVAAYVLTMLVEQSGDFDGYETGFTPEEMNEAAEKYCGCTIGDFNNRMTYLDQKTGRVKPTGWGGTGTWWVLRKMEEGEDGLRTAEFYYFSFSPDADLPDPQRLKKQLLAGEFESYGLPYLARMVFREKQDPQTGEMYLQILSLEALGDAQAPYTVYGSENS